MSDITPIGARVGLEVLLNSSPWKHCGKYERLHADAEDFVTVEAFDGKEHCLLKSRHAKIQD